MFLAKMCHIQKLYKKHFQIRKTGQIVALKHEMTGVSVILLEAIIHNDY